MGNPTGGNDGRLFQPMSGNKLVWDSLGAISHVPDGTNDFMAGTGLYGSEPHLVNCGGHFFFCDSANATNWIARTRATTGGSNTDTDTGVALVAETAYRFRVEWVIGEVKFFINNTLVATHTTNLLTTRAFAALGLVGIAGTTDRFYYFSDALLTRESL